jgi:dihydrolipoamide dehydrogenase
VGPDASDLIAEATLAVRHGLTAQQLADTIHAHPTLAESVLEAVEDALGYPIHG